MAAVESPAEEVKPAAAAASPVEKKTTEMAVQAANKNLPLSNYDRLLLLVRVQVLAAMAGDDGGPDRRGNCSHGYHRRIATDHLEKPN